MKYKITASKYMGGRWLSDWFTGQLEYLAEYADTKSEARQIMRDMRDKGIFNDDLVPQLYNLESNQESEF